MEIGLEKNPRVKSGSSKSQRPSCLHINSTIRIGIHSIACRHGAIEASGNQRCHTNRCITPKYPRHTSRPTSHTCTSSLSTRFVNTGSPRNRFRCTYPDLLLVHTTFSLQSRVCIPPIQMASHTITIGKRRRSSSHRA